MLIFQKYDDFISVVYITKVILFIRVSKFDTSGLDVFYRWVILNKYVQIKITVIGTL